MKKISIKADEGIKLSKEVLKRKRVYHEEDLRHKLDGANLDECIGIFQELRTRFPATSYIDINVDINDWDNYTIEVLVKYEADETDEEYNLRIEAAKEAIRRKQREAEKAVQEAEKKLNKKLEKERRQFERLKAKFEPNENIDTSTFNLRIH